MKKFKIENNSYLKKDIKGFYNKDYIGYQQKGNPDHINHLKNMTKQKSEIDLIEDFVKVCDNASKDIKSILQKESIDICIVVPRSKKESYYNQSQLMFKKAIKSVCGILNLKDGTDVIKRIKDTQTTHNWRLENNTGKSPYMGITKDTCEIDKVKVKDKNILLVDDIYTEGVNVIEDCVQTLFDFGAKNVILYVLAKTRS